MKIARKKRETMLTMRARVCMLILLLECMNNARSSPYPFRTKVGLEAINPNRGVSAYNTRIFANVPSGPSSRSIGSLSASLQGGGSGSGNGASDCSKSSGSGNGMRGGGGSTALAKAKQPLKSSSDSKAADAAIQISAGVETEAESCSHKNEKKEELKGGWKRARVRKDSSAAVYAKKLKNRNRMNLSRKVTHASFGLFFAALNHVIPRERFVPGMAILTSSSLLMELLRYRKGFGWMNDALHFVLGGSLRKHEMEGKFTGSFYYFLGVTMSAWLYPKTAATLGVCQLALADPSASYFGRQTKHIYWSRIENGLGGFGRNKGILGFLGGALFCFPFNYRVLSIAKWSSSMPRTTIAYASILLGLAGALADLAVPTPALTVPHSIGNFKVPAWIPPFHVDDNMVVPIFSAFACTKIFQAFGWNQELELARFIIF